MDWTVLPYAQPTQVRVRCGAVRVFGRCLHSGVDDSSGRKRTRVSGQDFGQVVEVGVLESYLRTGKRHGRTNRQ